MTPEIKAFMESLPKPDNKNARPQTADEWEASRANFTEEWAEVTTQTAREGDASADADSRRMSAPEFRQYLKRRHALHAAADDRPELPSLPAAEPPKRSTRQRVSRRASAAPDPVLKAGWASMESTPITNRGCAAPSGLFDAKESFILQHHLRLTFSIAPAGYIAPQVQPGENHLFELEYPNVVKVRELITDALKMQPQQHLDWGQWSYTSGFEWGDSQVFLFWSEGRGDACLDIRGGGCDEFLPARLLQLHHELKKAVGEVKCTRIDFAFDDYNRIASMDQIHTAAKAWNFTGFKRIDPRRPEVKGKGLDGDSAIFGRRGCKTGKYMRIYDKFLETGKDPNFDCIRYEVELTDHRSQQAYEEILACHSVEEYAHVMGSWIEDSIDFVQREGFERHIERARRLEWWEKITALLALKVRECRPRLVPPLASAVAALKRQWGSTLTLLRIALQSMPNPANIGAVVENWCDHFEEKINWQKQQGRDLGVSLSMLLEGPYRAALAAQEV